MDEKLDEVTRRHPRGSAAAGVARSRDHGGWNKGSYRRGIFMPTRERNVNQLRLTLRHRLPAGEDERAGELKKRKKTVYLFRAEYRKLHDKINKLRA